MRGRSSRSGAACGRPTPPGAGAWRGWRSRSASGSWRWPCSNDHGLTLPPETMPLTGLWRSSQLNWRRDTLRELRREVAWRLLLKRSPHVGPRRRQTLRWARLGFRGTKQNTLGGDAPKPFLSHGLFDNNGVSFRLFQLFPAEKPGGFPVPRIRDRLHRIEHRALRTAAQGIRTGGIEHRALPTVAPKGHIRRGRIALPRFGPSDTLVEVRPSPRPVHHDRSTLPGVVHPFRLAFGSLPSAGVGTGARFTDANDIERQAHEGGIDRHGSVADTRHRKGR